jgi:lipoprotein-anchoring transpeptidase ErfK/SrfK
VQAEQAGTKVVTSKVLDMVDDAVVNMQSTVTLDSSMLVQPTVFSSDAGLKSACDTANSYIKANLELVLGTTAIHAATINADQISQWVTLGADNQVTFDENAMNSYLTDLAKSLNTVGATRSFTTPYGKAVTISGGTYGWEIDTDSLVSDVEEGIKAGTTATITVPTFSEGATWSGVGGKDWGAYVDVDLTEQHARYYDASGNLLWETDVVTGIPDGTHNTPVGAWQLFLKESPSVLKGDVSVATGQPEYQTTVAYWMAFTYSGCGLHDATWQSAFGGTRYSSGYGSHGCVNLPLDSAATLYNLVSVGNAVIVHD